jgi:hypothetical protein
MIWIFLEKSIAWGAPFWDRGDLFIATTMGSILLTTTAQAGELSKENNLEFQLHMETDDWTPELQLDYRQGNTNYGSNIGINDRGNLDFGFNLERVENNVRYGGQIGIDVEGNWQFKTQFSEEDEELAYQTVLFLQAGNNEAGFLNLDNLQWNFDVESTWRGDNHQVIWNSSLNHQGKVDSKWEAKYSDENSSFRGIFNGDRFQGEWETVEDNQKYGGELMVDLGGSWKLQTNLEGTADNLRYSSSFILSSGSDRFLNWGLSWEGEYKEAHGEEQTKNTRLFWSANLGNINEFASNLLAEYATKYSQIEGVFHLHNADWKIKGKTQLVREENTEVHVEAEVGNERGYGLQARALREDSQNKLRSSVGIINGNWSLENQITYTDEETSIDFVTKLQEEGSWQVKIEREANRESPNFPGTFAFEANQTADKNQEFTMDTSWEIPPAMGYFSPLSPQLPNEQEE